MALVTPRLWGVTLVAVAALAVGVSLGHSTESPSEERPLAPVAAESGRGKPYLETRLYFGTGRHGGEPPISEEEFLAFVADHVTPRFPDGLTIQEGRGQWRDREGDINQELSYELIVVYPAAESRQRDTDIEHIRDTYTTRYELESVMRSDSVTRTDF